MRRGRRLLYQAAGLVDRHYSAVPVKSTSRVVTAAAASNGNGNGNGSSPSRYNGASPKQPRAVDQVPKPIRDKLTSYAMQGQLWKLKADQQAIEALGITLEAVDKIMEKKGTGPAALSDIYKSAAPPQMQQQQQQAPPPTPSTSSSSIEPPPPAAQQQQQIKQTKQEEEESTSGRISIRDSLNQVKIFLPQYAPGEYRQVCPRCKGGSSGEKSLGVTIEEGGKAAMWNCFRATCGYAGGTHVDKPTAKNDSGFFVSTNTRKRKEEPPVVPRVDFKPLTDEMVEFFNARGISRSTLERNKVMAEEVYDPALKQQSTVIAFPYMRDSKLVNVKYRTLDKRFWQSKGAEKILYGLDDVEKASEVVIVEGEMDKLALEEAGIKNVVSVPDGAPARVREGDLPAAADDTKYSYLWNCRAWLDQAVRIVIATDNDAPGDALAEELARRLGRERCWRVRWPLTREDHDYAGASAGVEILEDEEEVVAAESNTGLNPKWYRKDANEVLLKDGPKLLKSFIETAEPIPIRGLLRFHEYYDDIIKHYYLELKDGQGANTGWQGLDDYYKIVPGELTIVTGVPNSGKSEWIDALLCNLAEQHGWTFALCSMEKKAVDHARQLAEKYVGKPFFDLPYSRGMQRMSYEELDQALDWVDDRFHLIRYEDDQLPNVDWVLEVAKAAVYRYGIRGLVIDPYNELDHQRPDRMSETEYVSQMLTKVKRFAQTSGVHVWFVAHPRQLREWRGQAPNLYDISGSAHFINKADNGIVVHRLKEPGQEHQVQILVRKVRNKAAGIIGDYVLNYERVNGRYVDPASTNPPRTSARVMMTRAGEANGSNNNGGGMSAYGNSTDSAPGVRMYHHSDGTVSSSPEDAEFK